MIIPNEPFSELFINILSIGIKYSNTVATNTIDDLSTPAERYSCIAAAIVNKYTTRVVLNDIMDGAVMLFDIELPRRRMNISVPASNEKG
jgi:hypothetical protein